MSVVLNDLYDYDLKIYQDTDFLKFSLDSLLLAEFIEEHRGDHILDLCTGNAPIPLILAKRSEVEITALELQPEIYELAKESIEYNNLENKIILKNMDIKDANNYFPGNNFDIVCANPPFFKPEAAKLISDNKTKALARHEIALTLDELIKVSSDMLKSQGKFYLVHRPERLTEIIHDCEKYHLAIKKLCFIYSKPDTEAIMVLIKGVKNGRTGAKVYSKIINRETKTYQNIFKK